MPNIHTTQSVMKLERYLEESEADRAKHAPLQAWSLHHHTVPQSIHQATSHLSSHAQDELVLCHLKGWDGDSE